MCLQEYLFFDLMISRGFCSKHIFFYCFALNIHTACVCFVSNCLCLALVCDSLAVDIFLVDIHGHEFLFAFALCLFLCLVCS